MLPVFRPSLSIPALVVTALCLTSAPTQAIETPATWTTAGNGNYGDPANWDVPAVPCNSGPTQFLVTIPTGRTITVDLATVDPCNVDTLSLGFNALLTVASGGSYSTLVDASFNDARLGASAGSTASFIAPSYTTTGLRVSNGFSSVATTTWNILSAADAGTLLDLSSLTNIDAGFAQASNDINRHEITASAGAQIDLSSVANVTAPAVLSDWIRFNIAGATSSILLNSLSTLSTIGSGESRFSISDGATQALPALTSMDRTLFSLSGGSTVDIGNPAEVVGGLSSIIDSRFFLSAGSTLNDDGTPMTMDTRGLRSSNGFSSVATTTWDILSAADAGTLLDLSSLTDINAGFAQASNDINRHEITASAGAQIDLSSVANVTAPAVLSDWIRLQHRRSHIEHSPELALDSLDLGSGESRFSISDGATQALPALTPWTEPCSVSAADRPSTSGTRRKSSAASARSSTRASSFPGDPR